MSRRYWTPDEIETAERLRAEGLSFRAIGEAIGRTASSVNSLIETTRGTRRSKGRTCLDCAKGITNENKGGRCKPCATIYNNRLPETKAKRVSGWKKRIANPRHYADLCRVAAANSRKAMSDPTKRVAAQQRARIIYETYLDTPEMRAHVTAPETRARAGRSLTATRLSWCPPEYRDDYLFLINTKRMPASEARQIVIDQIAADNARELAELSPFERQDRALRNGAQLVANDRGPSLDNPGIYGERVA